MKVSLIELFEETVRKYPQKVAVIDKDREIAFSDLRSKSLQLASALMALGIGQNRPVGVFLDKSIESVYADLGILYAGDFYMNLDINGQTVQEGCTSDMLYRVDEIIAYISKFFTLKTGDMLYTGTPAGVGPVHIDDHLEGYLEERKVLEFNCK